MRKLPLLAALAALAVALSVPAASAIVPPKQCKTIKVGSKRIMVKADQMRCPRAVEIIRDYARSSKRPPGWTCQKNPQSKLRWRCFRGKKEAFGILRN
jgi:hypothetical protein